jgi:N-carbamoylputrescine amidase
MKVTVCEMRNDREGFSLDWDDLVAHVRRESTQLVLLPEMPFSPWWMANADVAPGVWDSAVLVHEAWIKRLSQLSPAAVVCTRPIVVDSNRYNEGFVWSDQGGCFAAHRKFYLPNQPGFWEASWYSKGNGEFEPAQLGTAKIGFLICTELWSSESARSYMLKDVHIIVTPRSTPRSSVEKWIVGGRATAIVAGAYSLSSNRVGMGDNATQFGGHGWVIDPDGEVLGTTSDGNKFLTIEIDLDKAAQAKNTYPRYVFRT